MKKHYLYAAQVLSRRLDVASHVVAGSVYACGLFQQTWEDMLAAGVAWLTVQGIVFFLNVYAGPPQ